jgi:hypothetical protein
MANPPKKPNEKHLGSIAPPPEMPPEFEQAAAIKSIVDLARTTPLSSPSEYFTHEVMHRLSEDSNRPLRTSDHTAPKSRMKIWPKRLIMPTSMVELASCFFLAGFFYLVMGLSLYFGIQYLDFSTSTTDWIQHQPIIALLMAFCFSTVGYILLKNTRLAFRIANLSIFCYILISIINGVQAHTTFGNHFSFNAVLCALVGSTVMGIFLAVTLHNFKRQSPFPSNGSI